MGGSVKDCVVYGMIKGVFDRGELCKGMWLVEVISGNIGIVLVMIVWIFNILIMLVMFESVMVECVKIM